MNVLKDEVNIVKELPPHLKSLDFEAIGSLVGHSIIFFMYFFNFIILGNYMCF